MEFRRKIEKYLEEWKQRKGRMPLIMRGARQVGKSTVVRKFGSTYGSFLELNLEKESDKKYFENYDDVHTLLEALFFERNIATNNGQILLFIDEIQESPKAIKLLRYFHEEKSEIHVIAAGSLLEFALAKVSSFPVGRVEQVVLHPFDFEEFLNAIGETKAIEYLNTIPLPVVAYDKLKFLFDRYTTIGGMPRIVKQYVEDNQTLVRSNLEIYYSAIWQGYKDDVEKYAHTPAQSRVLRHIMSKAPATNDRISFAGFGGSDYRTADVQEAFESLGMARVLKIVRPTSYTEPPLLPDLKRKPRIQFLDTGLLNFAANLQADMLLLDDLSTFYKGYIVNHIVNQEIIAQSKQVGDEIHFWVRENTKANAEVDLCIKYRQCLVPVEVKSGPSGRLRSLHEYMDRTPHSMAFRILANKVSVEKTITRKGKEFELVNLPYFLAGKLEQYMDWYMDGKKS